MLIAATIENFRGIERLHVEGLGRVNLIIGRNDSGKTALMEALELAWVPEDAGLVLLARQRGRHEGANPRDFDEFWLPIFRRMDAKRGFSIEADNTKSGGVRLEVRKALSAPPAIGADADDLFLQAATWALDCEVTRQDKQVRVVRSGATGVQFPPEVIDLEGRFWISAGPLIGANDIRMLSKLKQRGQDGAVIDLLRFINDKIAGIELLAPTGEHVLVFVRLDKDGLLPLRMMGEGVKRCFEFAVALASEAGPLLCIDEIENGLHYSVLEPLWDWIAKAAASRGAQVFVTTHSEECVQAACRAFKARNDNGLRVIRLDKQENETKAVVYDRDLVEAAGRMGVEIRG